MFKLNNKRKKNWRANVYKYKNHKVVVLIVLNKEGQLINRSIISSSGIKEADDAILKSIDEGALYPKFPQGFKGNILPIELTFDCSLKNMVNQSLNQSNNTNSLKSKYYELMQKTSQQQTYRPSVNSFNSNQDLLLKIKEKSENKK